MDINQATIDNMPSYTPAVACNNVVTQTVSHENESVQGVSKVSGDSSLPQGEQRIARAMEKAENLPINTTECQFSVHSKTNQVMIKMIDSATKEVIKEIPSEKMLDMVAKRLEIAGLFVDQRK